MSSALIIGGGSIVRGFVCISAASLSSRFTCLVIHVYTQQIKRISHYTAAVAANPMHVFGVDLWGRAGSLRDAHCLSPSTEELT